MIYGGRGAPDLVLLREMEAMGLALFLTTENGAVGDQGLVTRALESRLAHHRGKSLRVMGCGPNGMLWAIARLAREQNIPCFISLEEQMACGIGVCLGCAIPARSRLPLRLQQRSRLRRRRRARRRPEAARGACSLPGMTNVNLSIETGGIAFGTRC